MAGDDLIQGLVELPYLLEKAENTAEEGVYKRDERYFESAYSVLEGCWKNLIRAERELEGQYRNTLEDQRIEDLAYSVNLDSLDEDSHPATVALAMPIYYELLSETEDKLKDLAEEAGLNPDDYGSGQILPKES